MIAFFAKHPTAANLLMLAFLAAGIMSIPGLRRETFPDFSKTEVEVTALYPGATAEEVEQVVCQRIEDAIDGVRFVKEVRAEAREGVAVIVAEMEEGAEATTFRSEIETEINAIDDLPAEVEDPIVLQRNTTDPVMSILVAGPMRPSDLKAYCEDAKERLQQLPGVTLVNVDGFSDHQFRVALSADALQRFGLSAAAVADIIRNQSVDLPAGTLEARDQDIIVRFVEQRKSIQTLESLVIIATADGAQVRLSDVGTVIDLFENPEQQIILDGQRAGLLNVKKTKNQDTIRIARAVKEFVADERQRFPQLDIRITQDTSTVLVDRLQMLVRNAWQGITLVFLTMWLFFNVRVSFWVALSLPVSFLGAFFFMPQLNITINMMSMVGLLLALGLLMDDGIVIAENIVTHFTQGKSALAAAVDGVKEVKAGVLSSFVTTACILGPLATLDGTIGRVLEAVPIALLLVVIVSLVEAFLILPAHLAHSQGSQSPDNKRWFRAVFDQRLAWIREHIVGRGVDWALSRRYLWIGTIIATFILAIACAAGGVLKFQALPELDGDVIAARVLMPPGTPLQRTTEIVQRINEGLQKTNSEFASQQSDGQDLVQSAYARYSQNDDAYESGAHVATVFVDLLSADHRNGRIDDILQSWRQHTGALPGALKVSFVEPTLGPTGRNIEIRFRGADLPALQAAAVDLRAWLDQFEGVYNVVEDLRRGKPEYRLRLKDGALGLGLDAATVATQIRASFQGVTANEVQVGVESYEIDVRLSAEDQDSLADLDHFYLMLADGRAVPLSSVVQVELRRGWSRIGRVDGQRTVTVRGDVDSTQANTAQMVGLLEDEWRPRLASDYPGVSLSIEGEIKESNVTQGSLKRALVVGLIGVYVLLSFQFRSYVEPLIVMVAIPLALIGVIIGHLVMGMDLSMPSTVGFISLAGIVVNDSILLVLFIKRRVASGDDVVHAAAQATRHRFRAILITSLTTIAGLLPLLLERSLQAQVLIPLALSVCSGLLASTILVLLVIPCLYVILNDWGLVRMKDYDA